LIPLVAIKDPMLCPQYARQAGLCQQSDVLSLDSWHTLIEQLVFWCIVSGLLLPKCFQVYLNWSRPLLQWRVTVLKLKIIMLSASVRYVSLLTFR
jgi:hypothetical protein